jgi:hypothetical protein
MVLQEKDYSEILKKKLLVAYQADWLLISEKKPGSFA